MTDITTKPQLRVVLRSFAYGSSYTLERTRDRRNEATGFDDREAAQQWAVENNYPLCFHRWTVAPDGEHECSADTAS